MIDFEPSPRILPSLPSGKINIISPDTAPTEPSTSLVTILVPIVGFVISMAIMVTLSTSGSGFGISILYSIPMLLGSGAVSLFNYRKNRKNYRELKSERQKLYGEYLVDQRKDLEQLYHQQHKALLEVNPRPKECLDRVSRTDSSLWERSPEDLDFLNLRLGIGDQPFSVEINPPAKNPTKVSDPLEDEARKLANSFKIVDEAPVTFPLIEAGVAGLSGERSSVLNIVRALTLQIATHHSPADVKILAVFPASEENEWSWMRWLPHVWADGGRQRFLACQKEQAHELLASIFDNLKARKEKNMLANDTKITHLPLFVLFLADPALVEGEPIKSFLLTEGAKYGAYPVFLGDQPDNLPQKCKAIADIQPKTSELLFTYKGARENFKPDNVPAEMAEQFARAMAPFILKSPNSALGIPPIVTLFDLLGVDKIEDLDILENWKNSEPQNSLEVPIGKISGGKLMTLDMHAKEQGPHGLGAGMTGSGKSELLKTIIAMLSINFHPHELTFFVFDYKGRAMSNHFVNLPHLVGAISNLDTHEHQRRAVQSLDAEVLRRQRLMESAGEQDINNYLTRFRAGDLPTPLPHLIIIVDEFAQLKVDVPDVHQGIINIANTGRSLGIHLILTTQRPAGVINEKIRSNSNYRFCLKVNEKQDSLDVLNNPKASGIEQVGRAYFQENEELVEFQSAWSEAPYQPDDIVFHDPFEVLQVTLGGARQNPNTSSKSARPEASKKQLEVIVDCICKTAVDQKIERPPDLWRPFLPEQLNLSSVRPSRGWNGNNWLPVDSWMQPVIGLIDDPVNQSQYPLRINLEKEGHLVVYGAPESGKTTLLQTLIVSLSQDHPPADLHFYLLDFNKGTLQLFSGLPCVGDVVTGNDDHEKLTRLMRYIERKLDNRKRNFGARGVNNLKAYQKVTGEKIPGIVIIIDNYPGFITANDKGIEFVKNIAQNGGSLGIHLVLTANQPGVMGVPIPNDIALSIALELANATDYSDVVGPTCGLTPAPHAGRGLIKEDPPKEFQTALPANGKEESARIRAIENLISTMDKWEGPKAPPIPLPPKVVCLSDLFPTENRIWIEDEKMPFVAPLGLDLIELEPLAVNLSDGPNFLITGPPRSGKTTLLQSWLLGLAELFPPDRLYLYLVDYLQKGLFPFRDLPQTRHYITDDKMFDIALREIDAVLLSRENLTGSTKTLQNNPPTGFPAIVIAIDDFDIFDSQTQLEFQDHLNLLLRTNRGQGLYLLLASPISTATAWGGTLLTTVKNRPAGFLLGSTDSQHLEIFNHSLEFGKRGAVLPAGVGTYVLASKGQSVKIATPLEGNLTLEDWITTIMARGKS